MDQITEEVNLMTFITRWIIFFFLIMALVWFGSMKLLPIQNKLERQANEQSQSYVVSLNTKLNSRINSYNKLCEEEKRTGTDFSSTKQSNIDLIKSEYNSQEDKSVFHNNIKQFVEIH